MDFLEELKWRGLLQDQTPGIEALLKSKNVKAYAGFDPTADSLHIGNLVPATLLMLLQKHGHQPYVLMGGATGMIGDPSGKSQERKLLDTEEIEHNLECQKKQLEAFLDFKGDRGAKVVNNYDWFREMNFMEFLREAGKHITVSYMVAKDSVKSRLEGGISYAEFSYQLVQGYDFYQLFKEEGVEVQVGGSDQWGNMLTGTELIRRKLGKEAHVLTAPLITKADGSKFGKSEGGNVWLDAKKTSPYKFYQFWLNISDEESEKYIRIFSMKDRTEIENITAEHQKEPHMRILQKALAEEMTERIHSKGELEAAIAASNILFGKSTKEELQSLGREQLQEIFADVPQYSIGKKMLEGEIDIIDLLSEQTDILPSKGEARRMLKSNAISVNKEKVDEAKKVNADDLVGENCILVQRGKKNYYLINIDS